jgi:hypothetical protein
VSSVEGALRIWISTTRLLIRKDSVLVLGDFYFSLCLQDCWGFRGLPISSYQLSVLSDLVIAVSLIANREASERVLDLSHEASRLGFDWLCISAALGYGKFWDGAKLAAPSAEAVNLVSTAKEAALQQKRNVASAAPSAKAVSGKPSTKSGGLLGQQDSSKLPRNGSSQHEPSSITPLPGSPSQQSRPAEPSKAPQKSARSESLKPPAARAPPDTRKPQVIDGWLAAEKAKSIAEVGKWSQLHAKLDQHVVSKFAELKHAAALPTRDYLKTKNVVELKKLELLAVQKRLRREVMVSVDVYIGRSGALSGH